MKQYAFALITMVLISCLVACNNKEHQETRQFGTERYDSTALHVALVPNRDCFPIYYAQRTGIYDSLGLKLQIATYHSQLDCDTTLMGGIADGGWADRIRMQFHSKRMSGLEVMWNGTQQWSLFTCGLLRIHSLSALNGRTIGIARQSAESTWLANELKSAKVNADKVYLPQINNLKLRAQMLKGDQIDAAVTAWPYTSLAYANEHRCIATQRFADANGCFVMKHTRLKDADKKRQWKLLERGRRMAIDSIRIKGPKAYSLILQNDYGLPKSVADTIKY